jgi:cytochrome c553
MRKIILGAVLALVAGIGLAASVVLGGMLGVAADEPHHPALFSILDLARSRAIARQAAAVQVPAELADGERVRRGAGNYEAMCAGCHLRPGQADSEIRKGLYPVPPNLALAAEAPPGGNPAPAERFWVIKHGLKASGMPAWGRGGMSDEDIWNLVAFLETLPAMGPGEYLAWVAASDGHAHGGEAAQTDDGHGHDAPAAAAALAGSAASHSHAPGTPAHSH